MMRLYIKLLVVLFILFLTSCHLNKTTTNSLVVEKPLIKVGVFDGNGAGAISVIETIEALKIDKEIASFPISASDIISGKLDDIDALIFPGGSGSKQLNYLGYEGEKRVKEFINKKGKGVIGICAGAYMLCNTPTYNSLKIAGVKHVDRAHYNRGRGLVEFKLNKKGQSIFPELAGHRQFIQYYDGPIMENLGTSSALTELAEYVTDIHPNKGTPLGITPGKLFLYHEQIGNGRIFAIAGHAESTPGMRWMIPRMARWITGQELVSYDSKWIDPEKNSKPILFDYNLKEKEKEVWLQLFDKNPVTRMDAMYELYTMRSRPGVRWTVGMLRDENAKVRAYAAELTAKSEYSFALKDLEAAYNIEHNKETKTILQQSINFLK